MILAGFIDTENRHDLELSKKGRNVDRDVRSISEAKFPHHRSKNEVVTEKIEDDQDCADEIEEPWR